MLRPFIPASDFDRSRRFYEALGFNAAYADDDVIVMTSGSSSFILQNFYVRELAENFMVQLTVADCEAWWSDHDPGRLAEEFGAKPPVPPAMQSWGLKVGFLHDPSGVLWHVTEQIETRPAAQPEP